MFAMLDAEKQWPLQLQTVATASTFPVLRTVFMPLLPQDTIPVLTQRINDSTTEILRLISQ